MACNSAGSHAWYQHQPEPVRPYLHFWCLSIGKEEAEQEHYQELHLIYVSPLKSLQVIFGKSSETIERNFRGRTELQSEFKSTPFDINIGIRTGDTPQNERKKMIKNPPHILIVLRISIFNAYQYVWTENTTFSKGYHH